MSAVEIEHKTYEMPPREGISVAHFLTVADIDRSASFYEKVFDGRILSRGDSSGAPGYIQIANTWLLVNVGGGPTPDKPTVTLSVPDPDKINSFMNIVSRIFTHVTSYGRVVERSSLRSRSPSTARSAATCAIRTVTLSRSDRAPTSPTANTRPAKC